MNQYVLSAVLGCPQNTGGREGSRAVSKTGQTRGRGGKQCWASGNRGEDGLLVLLKGQVHSNPFFRLHQGSDHHLAHLLAGRRCILQRLFQGIGTNNYSTNIYLYHSCFSSVLICRYIQGWCCPSWRPPSSRCFMFRQKIPHFPSFTQNCLLPI